MWFYGIVFLSYLYRLAHMPYSRYIRIMLIIIIMLGIFFKFRIIKRKQEIMKRFEFASRYLKENEYERDKLLIELI